MQADLATLVVALRCLQEELDGEGDGNARGTSGIDEARIAQSLGCDGGVQRFGWLRCLCLHLLASSPRGTLGKRAWEHQTERCA